MSALPKAVQKQVDRANEILTEMNKTPDGEVPPSDEGGVKSNLNLVEEPPAPPAATETETEDEKWRHRYQVLQGKYNAEVPRLQKQLVEQGDQNREMRQRMNNLETMIATLQATRTPASKQVPDTSEDLTEQEIDTYGADLIDIVRRTARSEAKRLVPDMVKPVADKVERVEKNASQVSQNMAQSRQQETIRQLAAAVPGWEEQNTDEGFLAWLDQNDPYAGQPRGSLLSNAFVNNDANRVITFFNGYLNENAAVRPEASETAPETDKSKEPQTPMEGLVSPGSPKAPTGGAPNEAGKRVWSGKDITALFGKKNEFIRKHPGKALPDELVKLEKDLFKAQAEGRVRPT